MLGADAVGENGKASADDNIERVWTLMVQTLMAQTGMEAWMAVANYLYSLYFTSNIEKKIKDSPSKLKGQPPQPQFLVKHAGRAGTRS